MPQIYAAIYDRYQCEPHQCLFVGDTLEADVTGPKQYGMKALHLSRNGEAKNFHIQSLIEVPAHIRTRD